MQKKGFYFVAIAFAVLGMCFCAAVYLAGDYGEFNLGGRYLAGIPNYFLFYPLFLPFIAVGVIYLACANQNIRYLGSINSDLDPATLRKVRLSQKLLPLLCLLFCIVVVGKDAADKGHALLPYDFSFASEEQAMIVAQSFGCAKDWIITCEGVPRLDSEDDYVKLLHQNGFSGSNPRGFGSLGEWWRDASWIYRFDTLLSFLAAGLISVFLTQMFLLIVVKSYTKQATRNLIMWMLILVSFWFPTKIYTVWSAHFGIFQLPPVFIFAIGILLLAVVLLFFIKTERNDMAKIASGVTALVSLGISVFSFFKPEVLRSGIEMFLRIGLVYGCMLLILIFLGLFYITDLFLSDYEKEVSSSP